jgi:putative drug exporter of the RND superfamily
MIKLSRWCTRNRRVVLVAWVALAILANVVVSAVGRDYATDFSLPGTDSQKASDLLTSEFKQQSGDSDQIVFHYSGGHYDAAPVKAAIEPLLAKVAKMPHVVGVVSPFTAAGAYQVAKDGSTAFATVNYDKRANFLPDNTGKPVINAIAKVYVPGLSVAAGGQVIEQAEGFSIGPATGVGVVAALIILLLTFGSLTAAGMPLITAALGLITGIALVGLATRVTDMSSVAPELAIMIGLGVGIDYALFIVTRFRENYHRSGDVEAAIERAMDTSGRAILLAGTTVIIALLGMFATGVSFLYGLSIASILAVVLVLSASLTVLPALLSWFGPRVVKPSRGERKRTARGLGPRDSAWRRWSLTVQKRPKVLAVASLAVMIVCLIPFFSMRLLSSDAGNDPSGTNTQKAFQLIANGFGPGFNGPLLLVVELHKPASTGALATISHAVATTPDVGAVTKPVLSPSGDVAVLTAYPNSAPQAAATNNLVNHLRDDVMPPLEKQLGARQQPVTVLVGGFTAGSIDFSHVLSAKLPLFIAIVVVLSALLLFVIFRSLVIPIQAGLMNLLSIGGALGVTVLVFQKGWLAGPLGITPGPIEPWIPVLMFAVVFGLSMDYEVFLISRVREEWVRGGDATAAVADGISFTGRVITAAAAIMVLVFLSFMLGDERTIKEFGFGLAVAVFLDALVIRCVMLPAVLELLGRTTWALPKWLDDHLPRINIEGSPEAPIAEPEAARV